MSEHGTIIRIRGDKGYGFLASDLDGREYFFHASALPHNEFAELQQGDKVEFEPDEGPKGPRAEHVARL